MHRMCQGRTDLYSVELDVEMTRCATEIGREQVSRSLVEANHASLVQRSRSDHDQISTVFFQSWVLLVVETCTIHYYNLRRLNGKVSVMLHRRMQKL